MRHTIEFAENVPEIHHTEMQTTIHQYLLEPVPAVVRIKVSRYTGALRLDTKIAHPHNVGNDYCRRFLFGIIYIWIYIYTIALPVHLTTIGLLILLVLYSDHLGFAWMRGKIQTLPAKKMLLLHRMVLGGLGLMILSGGTMFWGLKDYLLYTPMFYIKMGFVATLIINSFFIGKLLHKATEQTFSSLTNAEKLQLLISGGLSTICWIGAIVAATQLGI